MLDRVLRYKSATAHYHAGACIVWCFDYRFKGVLEKYIQAQKIKYPDEVKGAGGAKALAQEGTNTRKSYILDQIKTSIRLHHPPKIILMTHSDCGGYGGLQAFRNDPKKEIQRHIRDLKKAESFLKKKLPRAIQVEMLFADFSGLWKI